MHKIKLPLLQSNQAAPSTNANASEAKINKILATKKPSMIEEPSSSVMANQSDIKKSAQSSVKNQAEAGPKTPFQTSTRKANDLIPD